MHCTPCTGYIPVQWHPVPVQGTPCTCTGYTLYRVPFPSYVPFPLHKHPDPSPPFHDCEFHRVVGFETVIPSPCHVLNLPLPFLLLEANLTIGHLTSKLNSKAVPSYLHLILLLYFLYIFYLPRCTLSDFPSVYYLASQLFLCCCHWTTTIGPLSFNVWKKGYFTLAPSAIILSEHLPQHGIRSPYNLPAFGPKVLSFRLPQPLQYLNSEIASW